MSEATHFSRRQFLQSSLAVAAALDLTRQAKAGDDALPSSTSTLPLIDTHVYVGRWPFRHVAGEDSIDLVATLRRHGVTQAWTGTFDGVLYKDIGGANSRLAETCSQVGDGLLVPFGSINPTLPDWEEDVRRCHEVFRMPGVRLHPNYHGYALDDPRLKRVLELAMSRGLIVQLVAWLDDERHTYLNPAIQSVDLVGLARVVGPLTQLRIVLANAWHNADIAAIRELARLPHVYFDFTRLDAASGLADFMKVVSPDRIVFGSSSPLMTLEASALQLHKSKLSQGQRRAIQYENARRVTAVQGK